jgi:mannosyltransferase
MDAGASNAIATGAEPAARARGPELRAAGRRQRSRGGATQTWEGPLGDAAAVGIPALLAIGLCLYGITARSLGFDESATATIVAQHGAALSHAIAHDGGNMSGYYVLEHALVSVFGRGLLVLRLPSALAVGFAVAATGLLALRLFDRRAAVLAGLLTAVSVSLVFWGQSARSYALVVAFASASMLAFVALVDGPRAPRWAWVAYVLCTALALYMSLMAALVVLAQLATFAWWWRRHGRAVISAVAAVAVLAIPLMVLATARGSGQVAWVSRPKFADLEQVLEAVTGAGLQPSIRATPTTFVLLWLTVAGLLAIAALIVREWRRHGATAATFGPSLLLAWLVAPVVLTFLESLVATPLFLPRNLLYCEPAAAVLLAWGPTRRGPGSMGIPRAHLAPTLALGAVAVLIALRALQLAPSYGVSPEDWQGATSFVVQHAQPGDCVAFYPSDGHMAFQYYLPSRLGGTTDLRGLVPRSVLPAAPWSRVRTYVEKYSVPSSGALARLPARCARLWFVSSHQGRVHGSPAARAEYHRYIAFRAALEREYGAHQARLFGYASAVRVELLAR